MVGLTLGYMLESRGFVEKIFTDSLIQYSPPLLKGSVLDSSRHAGLEESATYHLPRSLHLKNAMVERMV